MPKPGERMTVEYNDPVPDPDEPELLRWDRDLSLGINGRGVKRPGATTTFGARSSTSGEDVTNQVTAPDK